MIEKNVISNIVFGLLTSTTLITGIGGAAKVAQRVEKYKPELPQIKSVEEMGYNKAEIKVDSNHEVTETTPQDLQDTTVKNLPEPVIVPQKIVTDTPTSQTEITRVTVVKETKELPVSNSEVNPKSKNSLDSSSNNEVQQENNESNEEWDDHGEEEKDEEDKWEEEKKEMEEDWEAAKEEYENQKESHDEEDHVD